MTVIRNLPKPDVQILRSTCGTGTAPILVTARNAEAAFGMPWSALRALAAKLGVQPLQGLSEKRVIYRAIDIVTAIDHVLQAQPPSAATPDDDFAAEFRALGVVIRQ